MGAPACALVCGCMGVGVRHPLRYGGSIGQAAGGIGAWHRGGRCWQVARTAAAVRSGRVQGGRGSGVYPIWCGLAAVLSSCRVHRSGGADHPGRRSARGGRLSRSYMV